MAPEAEQDPYESRRLWSKVTQAIMSRNLDLATNEKSALEDLQREQAKARQDRGEKFHPIWFDIVETKGKKEINYLFKYHK